MCKEIKQVFANFTAFASALTGLVLDTTPSLIYLGLVSSGGGTEIGPRGQEGEGRGALVALTGGLAALHIILWKFVLIAFTKKDTEGTAFKPDAIWLQALRRLRVRLLSHSTGVRWLTNARRARGDPPPPHPISC